MSDYIRVCIHSAMFAMFLCSFVYHMKFAGLPYHTGRGSYAGKAKYLTIWNFALLPLFYFFSVLNDIYGTNEPPRSRNKSQLQKICDVLYASVIFPCSVFVVAAFWSIYAVDRELIFPRVLDKYVPGWLNHIMHTAPLPCLVWEAHSIYHDYPSRKVGLSYTIGFAVLYQIWILWVAYAGDFWVYPILEVLSWGQRAIFFTLLWCLMISIYITGESLTKFIWRKERSAALAEETKQKSN